MPENNKNSHNIAALLACVFFARIFLLNGPLPCIGRYLARSIVAEPDGIKKNVLILLKLTYVLGISVGIGSLACSVGDKVGELATSKIYKKLFVKKNYNNATNMSCYKAKII